MSETEPAFLAPRGFALFIGLMLAAVASVAAFSILDRPKAHETFSQTTAVGDTDFYTPPNPPLAVPEPVLTWEGRPWAPVSYDKVKIDDPEMKRVGRDDASGLTLYQRRTGGSERFVRIAIGEYLRVAPR